MTTSSSEHNTGRWDFAGKTGLVTGATSGIGRATALALASAGARVHAVGRDASRLSDLVKSAPSGHLLTEAVELTDPAERDSLCGRLLAEGRIDFLIHCAGAIEHATIADAPLADLDGLFQLNVAAPYALTKGLLGAISAGPGDVVFVNSSVTRFPRAHSGQFAATQHSLVGVADALREEVNELGVRVLSIFPGRTATERTRRLAGHSGLPYEPDRLLQPESVATTIVAALALPRTAEVTEIHIRPALKS